MVNLNFNFISNLKGFQFPLALSIPYYVALYDYFIHAGLRIKNIRNLLKAGTLLELGSHNSLLDVAIIKKVLFVENRQFLSDYYYKYTLN